jgi:hypothetical protein
MDKQTQRITEKQKKSLRPLLGLPEVQLGTKEPGVTHQETLEAARQEIVRLTQAMDQEGLSYLLKRIWHKQQTFKVSPQSVLNKWHSRSEPGKEWEVYLERLALRGGALADYTLLYQQCSKALKLVVSHQQMAEFCQSLDTKDSAGEDL